MKVALLFCLMSLCAAGMGGCAEGEQEAEVPRVHVAVASSLAPTFAKLEETFTRHSGIVLMTSVGSTGKFAVQIRQGAPFDVFLSADTEHPALLVEEGHAVPGSRYPFAAGRLMLWSRDPERVVDASSLLPPPGGDRGATLAIANPEFAPYGIAARQFLESQGQWEDYLGLRVMGENVGQAYRFARSGHAAMALVSQAQVEADPDAGGSRWLVPRTWHTPLVMEAVLLVDTKETRAFLEFLGSEVARQLLSADGYELPDLP